MCSEESMRPNTVMGRTPGEPDLITWLFPRPDRESVVISFLIHDNERTSTGRGEHISHA